MESAEIGFFYYVVSFLAVLTPLIFVHEMGHFLVARYFGFKIDVFSIGFGREIFGWYDKHGTRWKVGWLPLGGYVKFFGDANAASTPSEAVQSMSAEERDVSFYHKPLAQRTAVIVAGPAINFLFAIIIFAGLFATYGQRATTPLIQGIAEGSGAEAAGLLSGDLVRSIGDENIDTFEDIITVMQFARGEVLDVTVDRGGQLLVLSVQPYNDPDEDRFGNRYDHWRLGITGQIEIQDRNIFEAFYYATDYTLDMTAAMLKGIGQMIIGVRSLDELGGPMRIAQFSGEQASQGFLSFISFMAIISINLGLVNLFPIPMLDGGHLLFYGMEAVRGKPVSVRMQEAGYLIGLTLVLSLMVFVTWNDLSAFRVFESLNGLL